MAFLEALRRRVVLMHVSGIPVRADYRWFFVIVLMSVITAGSINVAVESVGVSFIFGLITTLLFFGCVFLHELAHAFAARMEGMDVLEIVLHPFGGLARLRHEPETPRAEFRIAIAGPAASFLLSIIFIGLMGAANAAGENPLAPLFFLLFLFNFLLAVFNLFPGYPLDGGRVLRAYLWRSGKDLTEATILTGRCGEIIGAVMIGFGLLIAILRMDFFTGFWTMLVGLFLYDAAKGIIREMRNVDHVSVGDIMQLPVTVSPSADLLHFIDNILTVHRRTVFPVAEDKQLYGMLVLDDMKQVGRERWHTTTVREVMRTVTAEHFVEIQATAREAREVMRANGLGAVCVIDSDGRLVGFLHGRIKEKKRG
jgi:Zn-dependent protease